MSAGKIKYVIEQGATFDEDFFITDIDDNPVDITGATATWCIKSSIDGSTLATWTNNDAITIYGAIGKVNVRVEGSETQNYQAGSYIHQLYMTFTSGDDDRVLEGIIDVRERIICST